MHTADLQDVEQFRWPDTTRILVRGRALQDCPGDDAPAAQVAALKAAITQRLDFRVTQTQVTQRGGDSLHMECATSGTTGTAKIIRRTQASWQRSFVVNAARFGMMPTDRSAVLGRLGHSLALYGLLEGTTLGLEEVHVLCDLRPDTQARILREAEVSILYATPTQLRGLAAHAGAPLGALRHVLSGGGRLDAATRAAVRSLCPAATITEFYGASETSFVAMSDARSPEGSVGSAYPGVEIAVRDLQGRATDGIGEIWVRSPYLFDGYAEGDSRWTRWQDGWLSVGEMGHVTGSGALVLAGRRDRMVSVADQNVFPEAVETLLLEIDGISQAAVLPVPDDKRGQALVAILGSLPDALTRSGILAHVRRSLGPQATPRRIHVHPDFPETAGGKPDLAALTHWLERQE